MTEIAQMLAVLRAIEARLAHIEEMLAGVIKTEPGAVEFVEWGEPPDKTE